MGVMYKLACPFVIVVSACGGHAPAPVPVAPVAVPVAVPVAPGTPPVACIDATAELESAVVTAHGVSLCAIGTGTAHTCWSVDLVTAAWTPRPALEPGDPDTAPVVKADANPIQVCAAGGSDCVSLTVPRLPVAPDASASTAATPERALVAVWTQASLRVFAVKGGRQLVLVTPWRTPMGQGGVMFAAFAGTAVAVLGSYSPVSSVGKLFDAQSGKVLGAIGPPGKNGPAEIAEVAPVPTGVADQWAFLDFTTSRLFVHETRRGKLVRTVDLFDAQDAQLAGDTGHDQAGLFAHTHDGAAVVVVPHAIGAWPLVIVDGATGKATKLRGPRCS